MINCLHLEILQCSCTCGQRWTHSYPLAANTQDGLLGGTPTPEMQLKLKVESYTLHYHHYESCWRCVPLQLSEGWTKPLPAEDFKEPGPQARPTTRPTAEDLLA